MEDEYPGEKQHDDAHAPVDPWMVPSDEARPEQPPADPWMDLDLEVEDEFGEDEDELEDEEPRGEPDSGLPDVWSAVGTVESHIAELDEEEWPETSAMDDLGGALEEVRDHVAAAFDVVREMAGALVPLAEQLEALTATSRGIEDALGQIGESMDDRFSRVERAMTELADWMESRIGTLEEAVGNDLEELAQQVGSAEPRPWVPPRRGNAGQDDDDEDEERGPAGDRFERLEAQIALLAEQVAGYKRRVQVHARPPVISDAQVQTVVTGVVDGLIEHQQTTEAREAEAKGRRRRRG